jgi:hypothetical protein
MNFSVKAISCSQTGASGALRRWLRFFRAEFPIPDSFPLFSSGKSPVLIPSAIPIRPALGQTISSKNNCKSRII